MGSTIEGIADAPLRTKINGAVVATVGSVIKICHGNEPGTSKEVWYLMQEIGEIEREVLGAIADLRLPATAFRRCDDVEAEEVVKKAKDIFVSGNPRSWWLSLKQAHAHQDYHEDGPKILQSHIPIDERRCWFIPETEEEALPVFDCEVQYLAAVLERCFFSEYYVVGKSFDWLLIDTDHNQIVICGSVRK